MGTAGFQGAAGTQGSSGTAGEAGQRGAQGPQGERGAAGQPGSQGEQGVQGPQGVEGLQGQPGARGAPGPQGPPGPVPTTFTVFGASANDPGSPKTANATCPSGTISGGGFAFVPVRSRPDLDASAPVGNTGWAVTVEELSLPAAENWQLLAFAVCVS